MYEILKPEDIELIFNRVSKQVIVSFDIGKEKEYIQHGNTSCYLHSLAVAYYSAKLVNYFGISCDLKSLIRGALLHDYFLYDWHEKAQSPKFHGFCHPYLAFRNASKKYSLNKIEKDIILRHMFPLTLVPPRYIESIVVCLVDKFCSLSETFKVVKYKKLKAY